MGLYMNLWAQLRAFSGNASWIGDFLACYMSENVQVKTWLSLILILIFFGCFMVNLFTLSLTKKIKAFLSQSTSASVNEDDP